MRTVVNILFILAITLVFCTGSGPKPVEQQKSPLARNLKVTKASIANVKVLNIYPHDPVSYTEGLIFHGGYLYESTGRYGKSFLKQNELRTGKATKEFKLSRKYFGEGVTILNNKIYQLTWRNQTGFIYNLQSFRKEGSFFLKGEGWGLTNDGKSLIFSNGTSVLTFLNPESFQAVHEIVVKDGEVPINDLNELEFINGEIWANIYYEDIIARISPETGKVLGWIDLSLLQTLLPRSGKRDVLNGIAYDPDSDRIFVTGKNWPNLFEIKVQNWK